MLNQQRFENASGREEQLAMMIEELHKKRKLVKRVYITEAIVIGSSLMSFPNLLKSLADASSDITYAGDISYVIGSYGLILIMAIILPILAKKKAKQFEEELDEQTTEEEKLLYKQGGKDDEQKCIK